MPRRLPDEFFREEAPAESGDVRVASEAPHAREPRLAVLRARERGVARGLFVGAVAGALLLGFGLGRLFVLEPTDAVPGPTPSATSAPGLPTASPTPSPTLVPYDGPTRSLTVLDATGSCHSGPSGDVPAYLIDANPLTIWRCPGAGVEEQVQFVLDASEPVVGVRLVNGNTAQADRYGLERRVLGIRWGFDDGSYVVQGLSANDRQPQELRFPPTQSRTVTMTVLDSTVPGGTDSDNDAVSISMLDFLTSAE